MANRGDDMISDQELSRLLASLKEEVAAPPDFRAKILARLQPLAPEAAPGPKRLVFEFFTRRPLLVGSIASALMALGAWQAYVSLSKNPSAQASQEKPAQELASSAAPLQAPQKIRDIPQAKPQIAQHGPAAPVAVLAEEKIAAPSSPAASSKEAAPVLAAGATSVQAPKTAPALAAAPKAQLPDAAASSQLPFGSNGVAASAAGVVGAAAETPIVVLLKPSATPLINPLRGNSEVRRNKFLASQGEYASILFDLKTAGEVRVEIFDRLGRRVVVLQDSTLGPGLHEVRWSGHDEGGQLCPTGIYLARIKTAQFDERHKIVFVR
ncbi:MAG: hypothetical protein V4498_10470 [candidate division FCPU426 bacterium]